MMLNLAVLLLIAMITSYLVTQGMVSALLALATSIFSSILAMALLEPLQGIIGGWRPDYARGVTFLLLFFLIFSLTRIIADTCVPKNIKLTLTINRLTGGVIGFFVSLVVVGNLLLGLEMLPINRTPLGFDRFPGDHHMQAMDGDKPVLGEISQPHSIWFAPERFVLAIWDGTSGRSLGGAHSFSSVHPDLSIESYGYRNQIAGSLRTLPDNLLSVRDAWKSADAVLKDEHGIEHKADAGKALVMVRTQIARGDQAPHTSADDDGSVRMAASQVRLITDHGHQYYPIGYLDQGRIFIPLTLDTGFVVDDFGKGDSVIDDWVFQVPTEDAPQYVEIKQLARKELTVKTAPSAPLALSAYPPHEYLKNLGTLVVTFDPSKSRELKSGRVLLIRNRSQRSDIPSSAIRQAYQHVIDCDKDMQNNANGWKDAGGPAVPDSGVFRAVEYLGQRFESDQADAPVNWPGLVPLLMCAPVTSNGERNVVAVPQYFDGEFMSMLRGASTGSLILASADADLSSGTAVISRIEKAKYTVIMSEMLTRNGQPRAFFVWVMDVDLGTTSSLKVNETRESPTFALDLDSGKP